MQWKKHSYEWLFSPGESHSTNIQVGQRLIHISLVLASHLIFAGESGEEGRKTDSILSVNPLVCTVSEDIITLQPSDCFHREVLGCLFETHALTGTYCRGYLHTLTYCQTGHQDILEILHTAWHAIGCDAAF